MSQLAQIKKPEKIDVAYISIFSGFDRTEGGSRTHTGLKAHWILSPARLPVPPLLRLQKSEDRKSGNRNQKGNF